MQLDPEMKQVLSLCSSSTKMLAYTLFPDTYFTDPSVLHDEIFKLIDSGKQKIAIAAPRGIGKTTIAGTFVMRAILFQLTPFIMYISNSATVAEMQTENIKKELMTNNNIKHFFGDVKESIHHDSYDDTFSKKSWTAFGSTFILPRGAGQQCRGLNHQGNRPGIIVVDDLEKQKELKSPENRENLKSWFFSDVMKTIDRYSNKWVIIYIDTLKHEDALLQELLDADDWTSLCLSICTPDYKSNVPQYMSDQDIQDELKNHREKGLLDEFYSEYMNIPISLEDQSFSADNFIEYAEHDSYFISRLRHLETILIIDPAKTVKLQSADSALVCIGIDVDDGIYYVRETTSEKYYPDQLYDELFRYVQKYSIEVVGIEVTSLHQFIVQPIKNEMFKRGIFFELIELNAQGAKEERVKSVVPYYRNRYMRHNPEFCAKLENQLKSFPKSKLWDLMDCLGYLPKMLEIGARYFTQQQSDDEEEYDDESEYADLESSCEEPIENWRAA